MAVSSIHSPKAKSRRISLNIGSLSPEQIHSMPYLQNANIERGETTTTARLLDSVHRPARRLLAHPSVSQQKAVLGFHIQRPGLHVQMLPFWVKHRAQGLHKDNVTCSRETSKGRHMGTTIPRRSSHSSSITGILHKSVTQSSSNHKRDGIPYQRGKITPGTIPKFRMVRSAMESNNPQSTSNRRKNKKAKRKSDPGDNKPIMHSERRTTPTRTSKLDCSIRSDCMAASISDKTNLEIVQKQYQRHSLSDPTKPQNASQRLGYERKLPSGSRLTITRYKNTSRRISKRLGIHNRPSKILRKVRQYNEVLDKRTRIDVSLVRPTDNYKKKCGYSGVVRQHNHNTGTKERGFSNIPTSCPVRNDMEKSGSSELDPTSGTYKRSFQCSSRPTLKRPNFINGVVANLQRLPTDSQAEQVSPSGLVCNSIESQTGNICQPMPGRHGNGSGCTDNQLGEVETPIPLSPVTADFPGFDETQPDYFYECSASHSRYTYETMVHGSHSTTGSFNCNGSKATTSCSEQDDDTTAHYQTSRMAVVRKAYESRFPTCHTALDLLAKPLRKSSLQDYEGKWLRFCNFLKEKNIAPKDLTLASVLEFFSYLFFEKNLRPGTVAHYRSALSVPLLLRFKIDLHDTAVTTLLKAMYIQKPNPPVTTPSWNLNKVLLLLNNLENSLSTDILLQKTAFLLLLATGWRVSELHACVRSREFCSISDDHTLRIRPHPSFLAKNECSKQRWTHKTIKPLINKDGSRGSLCPVASLKTYLQKTRKEKSHKLLLHPKSGKPLTIQQLSTYICKLIHQADPSSRRAKVHDIRKYAASCSLAETMDVSDMVTALQWSSETTFWKFYMAPTVPLSVPAVLPGTTRTDCSSMALTTLVDTHSELSAE